MCALYQELMDRDWQQQDWYLQQSAAVALAASKFDSMGLLHAAGQSFMKL